MRPTKNLDKHQLMPKRKTSLIISKNSKQSKRIISKTKNKFDPKKGKIDEIIKNLENNGPAGLFHLSFVSKAIKRSIRVSKYRKPPLYVIWNNESTNSFIDVVYHKEGRWTQKDENYKLQINSHNNNSLFNAISAKIDQTPRKIRHLTINEMKNNRSSVEKQIEIFDKIKHENSRSLLYGQFKTTNNNSVNESGKKIRTKTTSCRGKKL